MDDLANPDDPVICYTFLGLGVLVGLCLGVSVTIVFLLLVIYRNYKRMRSAVKWKDGVELLEIHGAGGGNEEEYDKDKDGDQTAKVDAEEKKSESESDDNEDETDKESSIGIFPKVVVSAPAQDPSAVTDDEKGPVSDSIIEVTVEREPVTSLDEVCKAELGELKEAEGAAMTKDKVEPREDKTKEKSDDTQLGTTPEVKEKTTTTTTVTEAVIEVTTSPGESGPGVGPEQKQDLGIGESSDKDKVELQDPEKTTMLGNLESIVKDMMELSEEPKTDQQDSALTSDKDTNNGKTDSTPDN